MDHLARLEPLEQALVLLVVALSLLAGLTTGLLHQVLLLLTLPGLGDKTPMDLIQLCRTALHPILHVLVQP